jgi:biopolymer transport protein ExbD
MKLNSSTPHKKARIEIIPLIDIMFFLLASFMLVSMSMIRMQAIQTNLPSAKTGSSVEKPDFIVIGIDKTNTFYFNKEKTPCAVDDLIPKLQPFYKEKGEELKVFVNADMDASYNSVVLALDQIRLMGIKKVSFPVKKDNKFDPNAPVRTVAAPAPVPASAPAAMAPPSAAVAPSIPAPAPVPPANP